MSVLKVHMIWISDNMGSITYLKKVKSVTLSDNEPYDVFLAIKDGKYCFVDDMGYNYDM